MAEIDPERVTASMASDETVLDGPRRAAPATTLVSGDAIGRFVVLEVLGSGGMGVVYSAYDAQLDRRVAIKLLHPVPADDPASARSRLLREAQAMAKINHPNVIKVHEVGSFRDQVFVAMEFSDAGTLHVWLQQPRTQREILDAFVQAGRGLRAAHAAGLVHRDFKPANVLVAKDGSIRVTDFGLVGMLAAPHVRDKPSPEITPLEVSLTRTGAIMGTPAYMAPEQFAGEVATMRSDQFAFCVALYEALYGERPFAGRDTVDLCANVFAGAVVAPPRSARVPSWLRKVLLRGLAVDPAARFAGMGELLGVIARDRSRVRWWLAAGIAACLVAITGLLALHAHEVEPCNAGDARTDGVWNAQRRAAMTAAFATSQRPLAAASLERATGMIDHWIAAWQAGYVDACQATRVRGEQSEHLLDLRMQCLARRLDETRATVALVTAGGPEAIDHALDALHDLPAIAPCGDAAALLADVPPPDDPHTASEVALVHAALDEVRAKHRLGKAADAAPVLVRARAAGYAPALAEALLVTGELAIEASDKTSVATLREALLVATRAGASSVAIDAAAFLVFALATQVPQLEVAEELAELADATADHARPGVEHVMRLANSIGVLATERGQPAVAQARFERALALGEAELGADHPAVLETLNHLGNLAISQARYADAERWLERLLSARERIFGKDHPDVADALTSLGNLARRQGKLDAAQRMHERALAIRLAAFGPDRAEVAESLVNLATVAGDRGDLATSEQADERALALYEKLFGPRSLQTAIPLLNLGSIATQRADYPASRARIEQAIAIMEAVSGRDHPSLATPLLDLGIVAVEQHHLDEALALYQRGYAITEAAYGPKHRDLASFDMEASIALRRQHKLDQAQMRLTHALALAPGDPMILTNLGNLQLERSDFSAALATFTAVEPPRAQSLSGMAMALMHLARPKEAVPLLERALTLATGPDVLAVIHLDLADALATDPHALARAVTEARAALAEYTKAGDADSVAEVRQWLRAHAAS